VTSGSRDVLVAADGEVGNDIVGRRFSVEIHVRFQAFGVLVADGWTATTGRHDIGGFQQFLLTYVNKKYKLSEIKDVYNL